MKKKSKLMVSKKILCYC